jgi:hypothetical protein
MNAYDIHDRIAGELLKGKSLAALIWLIQQGRELEFQVGGHCFFLSRDKARRYVSLWEGQAEQSFDSVEELLENAVIRGEPFLLAWEEAELTTLF